MNYEELCDLIADLMHEYGPDGHMDGCQLIATEIYDRVNEWKEPSHEHDWKYNSLANGFYRCSICNKDSDMTYRDKTKIE